MYMSKECEPFRAMENQRFPLKRCPGVRQPPVPNVQEIAKVEFVRQESPPETECHEKFTTPLHRKLPVTRESRLAQFWWHEFYAEYLRSYHRNIIPHPIPKTEYTENYEKEISADTQDAEEAMSDKYPIYASSAITMYNPTGDKTCKFNKKYSITRPLQLSDEQFG